MQLSRRAFLASSLAALTLTPTACQILPEQSTAEPTLPPPNEDGSKLWLRYPPLQRPQGDQPFRQHLQIDGASPTTEIIRTELATALPALLGTPILTTASALIAPNTLLIGTPANSTLIRSLPLAHRVGTLPPEGFIIRSTFVNNQRTTLIASPTDLGTLYGTFHFLRLMQTAQPISNLDITDYPRLQLRLLNHWDNVNGTIERGYAGRSLWNWADLPQKLSPRYTDYARACASLGINGTVLNNVNANIIFLTPDYLQKAAALAWLWEPYGIRVYLSINFSSPVTLGKLATADPLDPTVIAWWKAKADEIYSLIPNFGGFLVKANSEGQPGPRDYQRTHAQGANVIADALAPHHGNVIWRAFVYDEDIDPDRANALHIEFTKSCDGQFRPNVTALTNQKRPHRLPAARLTSIPCFDATQTNPHPHAEIQATHRVYRARPKHLVYLGTMWEKNFCNPTLLPMAPAPPCSKSTPNLFRSPIGTPTLIPL